MNVHTDWPTDSGPLATLRKLGLHTDSGVPKWARNQRVHNRDDGPHYRASPIFLTGDAVRHLAALSLDGYGINVRNAGELLDLDIWKQNA